MFSPGGVDWVSVQQTLWQWVVNGSGLDVSKVVWAQQDAPRPTAPAIVLRIANIAETGDSWTDWEPNPLTFTPVVSSSMSGVNTFAFGAAHGLSTGDGPVQLTGTLPPELATGTDYWVIAPSPTTLQFAATYVNTGGGDSSNPVTPISVAVTSVAVTVSGTGDTVHAGAELIAIARVYLRVTLELHCHSADGVGLNMAQALLQRVRSRRDLPSQSELLLSNHIGVARVEHVRAIQGIRDAMLFEPRAYLEIQLCIPSEESQAITLIESVDVTDLITGQTEHLTDD